MEGEIPGTKQRDRNKEFWSLYDNVSTLLYLSTCQKTSSTMQPLGGGVNIGDYLAISDCRK